MIRLVAECTFGSGVEMNTTSRGDNGILLEREATKQTTEKVYRRRMRRSATPKTPGVFGCCPSGRPSMAFSTAS